MKIVRSIYVVNKTNRALYSAIDKLTERNIQLIKENAELHYYQGFKPLRCVKYKRGNNQ